MHHQHHTWYMAKSATHQTHTSVNRTPFLSSPLPFVFLAIISMSHIFIPPSFQMSGNLIVWKIAWWEDVFLTPKTNLEPRGNKTHFKRTDDFQFAFVGWKQTIHLKFLAGISQVKSWPHQNQWAFCNCLHIQHFLCRGPGNYQCFHIQHTHQGKEQRRKLMQVLLYHALSTDKT